MTQHPALSTLHSFPLPQPRVPVNVRPGTMDDLQFIDALQKKHAKMVGWMPMQQLEGKVRLGHVLVAEATSSAEYCVLSAEQQMAGIDSSSLSTQHSAPSTPLGYVIGNDQCFKRDDVGIIYQMNVEPGQQRKLVGAALLKAMFDRAAYGCRLFCCWCAQDIQANYFWESLGFVPLAFRAGSRGKGRVHIFWQKRIREGDTTTPYWYPTKTSGGSLREDRIVLPIPPGTHWSDAKPMVLPGESAECWVLSAEEEKTKKAPRRRISSQHSAPSTQHCATGPAVGGFQFFGDQPERKRRVKDRPKVKNDPKVLAAARDLNGRWLEEINSGQFVLEAAGKYNVTRSLGAELQPTLPAKEMRMLPAA